MSRYFNDFSDTNGDSLEHLLRNSIKIWVRSIKRLQKREEFNKKTNDLWNKTASDPYLDLGVSRKTYIDSKARVKADLVCVVGGLAAMSCMQALAVSGHPAAASAVYSSMMINSIMSEQTMRYQNSYKLYKFKATPRTTTVARPKVTNDKKEFDDKIYLKGTSRKALN